MWVRFCNFIFIIDFQVKCHVPKPKLLPDDKPTGLAYAADVLVDSDPRGKSFYYIDDITTLGYYDEDWESLSYATSLIISAFGRPVSKDEPLPRDHLTLVKKLVAEGGLAEVKVVLG